MSPVSIPPPYHQPVRRPGSATTVAVISILLGVLCGCTSIYGIFAPAMMRMQANMMRGMQGQMERDFERQQGRDIDRLQREREDAASPEERERIDEDIRRVEEREMPDMEKLMLAMVPPEVGTFYVVSGIIGTVISLLLLVSGIGLLPMMEWARKLNIGTSVADILFTLGSAIYSVVVLGPATSRGMEELMREMQKTAPSGGPQPPVAEFGQMMQVMMGSVTVVIAFILIAWFITAILLLRTRRVREAFRAASALRRG